MPNRPMHEVILRRSPVTLRPEATVQQACIEMRNHRIGAVLVTDPAGRRLAKRDRDLTIGALRAAGHSPAEVIGRALAAAGNAP